jgi:formiminotetrahydrofolate cyclodeaminase
MSPSFLEELSQARPDPGGGAAAAYAAALGLGLLAKVAGLEAQRWPGGAPDPFWEKIGERLRHLEQTLIRLQAEDVQAYAELARARASGNETLLAAAVREAVAVPRRIMREAREALRLLARAGGKCKAHLVSDLLVACEFLGAAAAGAHHIARANLPLIKDPAQQQSLARELDEAMEAGGRELEKVRAALQARGPRPGGQADQPE